MNEYWCSKKQESSRKASISVLLTMPKPLTCVDHNKLWKILKEMCIPDHLAFLLRNLYAGQETTVQLLPFSQGYGFPVVMYGCESWTEKKAEHRRIDAFNCGVGEDS